MGNTPSIHIDENGLEWNVEDSTKHESALL
jgi:hypothetical protein